jgi:hypothetical protein
MKEGNMTDKPKNVHQRLSDARAKFHALSLKKTGKNTFAGYTYFELGDFLIPAMQVFRECGLGTSPVTFSEGVAVMLIVNLDDPNDYIGLESPMGSAALKGCHEVQNVGAVQTYLRRYLWVNALEVVEHDALDASKPLDDKPALITDADCAEIISLIEASGADAKGFCSHFGIKSVKELPVTALQTAKRMLNKKLAEKSKTADLADDAAFLGDKA